MSKLALKTAASVSAISVAETKEWLRTEIDEDMIASLIGAAVEELRGKKQIVAVNETWTLYLDEFPPCIELPLRPVSAVNSVKYYDSAGVLQTLSASIYQLDKLRFVPRLVLASGQSWPAVQSDKVDAVEVEFVAGYGAGAANVPEKLRNALKCKVSELYYGDDKMAKAYDNLAAGEAVLRV